MVAAHGTVAEARLSRAKHVYKPMQPTRDKAAARG